MGPNLDCLKPRKTWSWGWGYVFLDCQAAALSEVLHNTISMLFSVAVRTSGQLVRTETVWMEVDWVEHWSVQCQRRFRVLHLVAFLRVKKPHNGVTQLGVNFKLVFPVKYINWLQNLPIDQQDLSQCLFVARHTANHAHWTSQEHEPAPKCFKTGTLDLVTSPSWLQSRWQEGFLLLPAHISAPSWLQAQPLAWMAPSLLSQNVMPCQEPAAHSVYLDMGQRGIKRFKGEAELAVQKWL